MGWTNCDSGYDHWTPEVDESTAKDPDLKIGKKFIVKNGENRLPLYFKYTATSSVFKDVQGDYGINVAEEEEPVWIGYKTVVKNLDGFNNDEAKKILLKNYDLSAKLRKEDGSYWLFKKLEEAKDVKPLAFLKPDEIATYIKEML